MKNLRKLILSMILVLSGSCLAGCSEIPQIAKKSSQAGEMTVHFLDVGQGLSILAQSEGQTLLYDGGDRSSASYVVSYLKKHNVENIDYLISSHYDADHVSGLIGCLNAFSVSNVIGADYVHDSGLYRSFMEGVADQGLEVLHPEVGTTYSFGTGEFMVLSPAETDEGDSNANSVAIKLTNGSDSFLLMGDAEYKSEAQMINAGIDLSSDVLSVGHHGSASSTSWDFLKEAVPEYAVISCGTDNQYGHPDADTMEKLSSMEIEVFRNDKQGTIVGVSDGNGITWSEKPCNDYTPGDSSDMGTQPSGESEEVWVSASGTKYHSIPDCGTMNPDTAARISLSEAKMQGYEACGRCMRN